MLKALSKSAHARPTIAFYSNRSQSPFYSLMKERVGRGLGTIFGSPILRHHIIRVYEALISGYLLEHAVINY